ncbi:MAG TPA: hypothetical protein VGS07_10355 [Thermoanaerobaculia bacterium]|jgi:hypothetical protein|nr:hypothetical protein [Thermoanaerobaculia bacterium]
MPLTRLETANGPVWVRAPYRPEDYTAPQDALHLFERWQRDDVESSQALLTLRDGPFGNYVEVGRQARDGKTWLVLLEASREFGVEVETRRSGFGKVVAIEPRRAYELAVARDPLRKLPVVA